VSQDLKQPLGPTNPHADPYWGQTLLLQCVWKTVQPQGELEGTFDCSYENVEVNRSEDTYD